MNVVKKWNPWDEGGPIVFHSEWWIREHWGRAFEVEFLERNDPAEAPQGQGATLLRRREERPTVEELERAADDPRELAAALHNVKQLHREADELAAAAHHAAPRPEVERLRAELDTIAGSRSWRLTAPFRSATALLRKRGG